MNLFGFLTLMTAIVLILAGPVVAVFLFKDLGILFLYLPILMVVGMVASEI